MTQEENLSAAVSWEKTTEEKFKLLLDKMPVFLRGIAQAKVSQKAESLAREENRSQIIEKRHGKRLF